MAQQTRSFRTGPEYTGEKKPCRKAEQRLDFAVDWFEKHPIDRKF
jgi:hypothetical protein